MKYFCLLISFLAINVSHALSQIITTTDSLKIELDSTNIIRAKVGTKLFSGFTLDQNNENKIFSITPYVQGRIEGLSVDCDSLNHIIYIVNYLPGSEEDGWGVEFDSQGKLNSKEYFGDSDNVKTASISFPLRKDSLFSRDDINLSLNFDNGIPRLILKNESDSSIFIIPSLDSTKSGTMGKKTTLTKDEFENNCTSVLAQLIHIPSHSSYDFNYPLKYLSPFIIKINIIYDNDYGHSMRNYMGPDGYLTIISNQYEKMKRAIVFYLP